MDLAPTVFLDHAFLLEVNCLGAHGPIFTNDHLFHPEPPVWRMSGGDFSMPAGGELCMPADRIPVALTNQRRFGPCDCGKLLKAKQANDIPEGPAARRDCRNSGNKSSRACALLRSFILSGPICKLYNN